MDCNYIETEKTLNIILEQIKNNEITIWTLKPHKLNVAKTLSMIGNDWQNRTIDNSIEFLTLVHESLNYMSSFLICGKIDYPKYEKITDLYLDNILDLDLDSLYERSIESLSQLGYNF